MLAEIRLLYLSKNFATYPWNIPQTPNQQFMFRNSFHLGVKGEAWGMLQGHVGVPLESILALFLVRFLNFVLWPCSESIATIFYIFFMSLFRSYQMMMRSHINLTYSSSSEVANVQGDISLPEIPNIIKNCVVSSWKADLRHRSSE